MLIFIETVFVVYLLAINFYAVLLVRSQKNAYDEGDACSVKDGKVFITGLLGGALGVYISMFVFKYKLSNLFLMVFMPVLIAINAYVVYLCFSSNFGMVIEMPYVI